jgi:4-carboxymuconolactone decarboxylase
MVMARVPLLDVEGSPALRDLAERIRSARRGRVINVYRLLLHSPPLAETWFEHNNAVRWHTQIDGRLREIVIVRIGHLNRARYVLGQHVPKLAAAEGVTLEECESLNDWQGSRFFDERERAVLAYADAMTHDVQVPDAAFEPLRRHFDDRAIVELTVLIGTYAMHTRVCEALALDPEGQGAAAVGT